jgi:hypothetical protein
MCVRECDHTWPIAGKRSQAHIALAQSSVVSASPTVAYHSLCHVWSRRFRAVPQDPGMFADLREGQALLRIILQELRGPDRMVSANVKTK